VNYGHDQQELQEKSGGKFSKTRKRTQIKNDNLNIKEISEKIWSPSFRNLYEIAKDNCSFYMTMCQGGEQMMMMMKMNEHWQIKHELIFVKNALVFSMGRLDYDYQHEPILFGWKKKHNFYGKGQFLKSIWQINKPIKSDLHPTMKPVELIENALLNSSNNKDLVIDFFLGSGTTLIACEKLNRRCFGMEIEPIYCDVAVKRWEEFTGRKAELVRGGIAPKESKLSQVQSGA
jgi:DNA modification methylase